MDFLFCFLSKWCLVKGYYQTWHLGATLLSENIRNVSSTSFPVSLLIENAWKVLKKSKRALTSGWKTFWPESVVECGIDESEKVPNGLYSQGNCVFGHDQGIGGG
ncbi:hypothetical protein AVEN_2599-1 [Araneus ventricosus]|uniref:DDE-1 domain-containing protein n=1 Tax=Araneus ventricosus TaxID=182803 RepID=A0A4Y2NGY4_ARAVE|nr:hypothetical protein AVEN_2599-1 [Araneus ventricosus]